LFLHQGLHRAVARVPKEEKQDTCSGVGTCAIQNARFYESLSEGRDQAMKKMQYFTKDLNRDLKDPKYRKQYEEQLKRLRLGLKIARLRQELGVTQAQLAHRAHTSQQAISRIEAATYSHYSVLTLQKLASAMGKNLVIDFK
jgi:DNA-binding XRE family transcriptional regulator